MTSPQYYAPRNPNIVDAIQANKRITDAILRNNPLQDAIVSRGLIKWLGNYVTSGTSDKINFLWIGEFFPADPNLGGIPQRGISMVRDDSRGGVSAIAIYDAAPGSGGGLRQTLRITSGDGFPLAYEHRYGGWEYPSNQIPFVPFSDVSRWPGTTSATELALWRGTFTVLGNYLRGSVIGFCETGTTGEVWLRVVTPFNTYNTAVVNPPSNGYVTLPINLDIRADRNELNATVFVMARHTGGPGRVAALPEHVYNITDAV